MTKGEFELMDIFQQAKAIALYGELLAEREDDFFYYRLYYVTNNFFVEEKTLKTGPGDLASGAFITGPDLLPYLRRNEIIV